MDFGLACEGITDQITIENILCGYFNDVDDLDEEITYIQPAFDETDNKQSDFGGWESLLQYLSLKRFRDDVLNTRYSIIQIDTDVSQHKGFDISHMDAANQELSVIELIDQVQNTLIDKIKQGDAHFYSKYHQKIIFCITVHSLECWLFSYHNPRKVKSPKIKNCEGGLKQLLSKGNIQVAKKLGNKFSKNYAVYDVLSQPFLKKRNIDKTALIEPSFEVFIKNLSDIDYPSILP